MEKRDGEKNGRVGKRYKGRKRERVEKGVKDRKQIELKKFQGKRGE